RRPVRGHVLDRSLTATHAAGRVSNVDTRPARHRQPRLGGEAGDQAVDEHGAALDLGGEIGSVDGIDKLAGATFRAERDHDHDRLPLVCGQLALAGDHHPDVRGDHLGLPTGDARLVAVRVGDVADGEDPVLPGEAQVLVDVQVTALVAGTGR